MISTSIAMTTFNGGRYLSEQLESFRDQTTLPDELIVCDDGSTDDTPAIITAFARRATFPVTLIRNLDRLGYNANFAKAIGLCSGRIIFLSDQDDRWFADKIATVTNIFAARPALLCIVNDQQIANADGSITNSTVLENIRSLGYSDAHFGPGCCTALSHRLLPLVTPFPGDRVPYDHWVTAISTLLAARCIHETPLQLYRRHATNTSGSLFARQRPGLFAQLSTARGGDARRAFATKLTELSAIGDRLAQRRDEIAALGLGDRYDAAQASVARESEAFQARLDVLSTARLGRVAAVAGTWRRGTYNQFRGTRTALKDLFT